jgi:hypothetical protein
MDGAEPKPTTLARALRIGVSVLPWLPMLLFPGLLVSLWKLALVIPYQLDYGEAEVLHSAIRMVCGESIYPAMGGYPYVNTPYPPLYIALCAAALRLTGPGLLLGRLISMVSGAAVLCFAAAIVWRETRSRSAAALAPALLLSVGFFDYWIMLMRVDALALALSMLGLLLALRRRHVAAALVFAAAICTRQSALAAPAAVILTLALERRWRDALRFAIVLALPVVIAFAAIMLATRGWFYAHAFTVLARHAWDWSNLPMQMGRVARYWPALAALGLAISVWTLVRGAARTMGLYFLISAAVSISVAKIGASFNYFLEPFAAACVLIGVACGVTQRAWFQSARARLAGVALALLLAAQLFAMAFGFVALMHKHILQPFSPPDEQIVFQRILGTKGDILCEDYSLLDLAGRPVLLEPFEFTRMVRAGLVDPTPVLADIQRRRFALIVMRLDPETFPYAGPNEDVGISGWYGPLVNEIRANYRLREEHLLYYLLVPR